MTVTLTPRFNGPQWSSGQDSPGRQTFNQAFANLDARGAIDPGANDSALPSTFLSDGRYAHVISGSLRQLYRRGGGAWQQVGGNSWGETQYEVAGSGLAQTASARERYHASLTNPTLIERWDGGATRGGRFAIGDVNSGVASALHVGDTAIAVDLTNRGRAYVRTTATGHRGLVVSAHAADAGPLISAREPGGTDPWTVDALGRMRAQVPTAFGAGVLTTGVPLSAAPGASDLSAIDVYAASAKPALRVFRAAGDAAAIALFEQDKITLGRASWAGAQLLLQAPTLSLVGALGVTGAVALSSTLAVTGAVTAPSVVATGQLQGATVTATGQLQGASLATTGAISAHNGLVVSAASGSGAQLLTRPPVQLSGTAQASVRQATAAIRAASPNVTIDDTEGTYDLAFVMPEDGWLRADIEVMILADVGSGGSYETVKSQWIFDIRSGSSTVASGATHAHILTTDDSARHIRGLADPSWTEVYTTRLTAGSYALRVRYSRSSVLAGTFQRVRAVFTPIVLHSTS